jgi:hypothetical protein
VHAVMLGGESPLSRWAWSRWTKAAPRRHNALLIKLDGIEVGPRCGDASCPSERAIVSTIGGSTLEGRIMRHERRGFTMHGRAHDHDWEAHE